MPAIDPILMEIEQEAKVTQRVLERIPADKLTWKPHPKSLSLGQLAMHIAVGQGRLAEILAKDTHEIGEITQPQPGPNDDILKAFNKGTADALSTLKNLSDSQLMTLWTLTKGGKVVLSAPPVEGIRPILMTHFYLLAASFPSISGFWT